ncbi:MAG: hypothetical protein GWO23_03415, partial [Gammaproteobacteria bacterium]|nr:hypothetical protein [Gammaproteobacteria bacterium]
MAAEYEIAWLSWLPIPFVLAGVYFSVGHLLQARLEWNNVSYAITNKRLLASRGVSKTHVESIPLSDVTYFKLRLHG